MSGGSELVLVHGWAMHGGIFAPLAQALSSHFRIHAPDLPGHGLKAKAFVPATLSGWAEALLAEAPERAWWLGWSLGGLVALEAARLAPERVAGLVLVASSPRLVRAEDWPGADPALLEGFAAGLAADLTGTLERFLALEVLGSGRPAEALRFLRAHAGERGLPAPAALARGLELLQSADLRSALPALAKPSLWLAGANDRIVPPAGVEAGARLAGGAFVRLPRAGHAPFLTRAEEVAAAILAWARP